MQEKSFSPSLVCGHCRNTAPMEIVHVYSQAKDWCDRRSGLRWEAGVVYEHLLCPACSGVSLRKYYCHEIRNPEEITFEALFPIKPDMPPGLPELIEDEFLAALRGRNVSPNAYGVLLGRLLELVCEDRGAEGGSLRAKLQDLAGRNEIPSRLVKVAMNLRQFRNVGAHATAGALTEAEVPILDRLCRAVLEYVYSAPELLRQAEEQLSLLKQDQRRRKRSQSSNKKAQ